MKNDVSRAKNVCNIWSCRVLGELYFTCCDFNLERKGWITKPNPIKRSSKMTGRR